MVKYAESGLYQPDVIDFLNEARERVLFSIKENLCEAIKVLGWARFRFIIIANSVLLHYAGIVITKIERLDELEKRW